MNAFHRALDAAGPQAAHIAQLWWFTIAICAFVFVAVVAALLYATWRAPRADAQTAPDVSSLHASEPATRLAVSAAVGVSIALLVVLVTASAATDRALSRLPLQDAINVQVTAHQWWWEVRYDDPDPTRIFSTANEMRIPAGRPVVLRLRSDDVIHSFWVPELHGKKDLIPGKESVFQLRADRPGDYRGVCAEFCGLQHAFMAFNVTVVSPGQFEQWRAAQLAPAGEPTGERERRGRELFLSGSCMMCHAIQGTTAQGRKAPDLTHIASRGSIGAGRLANTAGNLAAWIENPQRFKPGVNMPSHSLPPADLAALVAYLGSLR